NASDGRSSGSTPFRTAPSTSVRTIASTASAGCAAAVCWVSTGVSVTVSPPGHLSTVDGSGAGRQRRFFFGRVVVDDRCPGGRRAGRGPPDGPPAAGVPEGGLELPSADPAD